MLNSRCTLLARVSLYMAVTSLTRDRMTMMMMMTHAHAHAHIIMKSRMVSMIKIYMIMI
jgi:hypothetical protein